MAQSIALLQESHENLYLPEGYYVALQFEQGWLVFMVTGAEPTNMKPFSLGGCSAQSNLSDWNEVKDSSNRKYLEPIRQDFIKQVFWGVSPPKARIFFQYPSRQDRWSLINVSRTLTGNIGYIDGGKSPFNGPFSRKTEIWTVYQLYPAFQVYNPTLARMLDVAMNFDIVNYTYNLVLDKDAIKAFLSGERRIKKHTVGGIDPKPATAPQWLVDLYKVDKESLFKYTRDLGY